MQLPNGDRGLVGIEKLRNYCLNLTSEDGKHEARVFASVLGLVAKDAEELQVALLAAARNDEALDGGKMAFDRRYTLDSELARQERTAMIRSGWIVRQGEHFPRLTICFVRM